MKIQKQRNHRAGIMVRTQVRAGGAGCTGCLYLKDAEKRKACIKSCSVH